MKATIQRLFRKYGYEIHRYQDAFRNQEKLLAGINTPVIFDVGAHRGYVSTLYHGVFPKASIYAFEPSPDSFAVLQKRTASIDQIHTHNLALSNRTGTAEFHVNPSSATNSLLSTQPGVAKTWGQGLLETIEKITVPTSTIDDFCQTHHIDRIDLLKLDVQGAEPLVLEGAKQTFAERKVSVIYTEIITMPSYSGQAKLHEYMGLLNDYGFCLYNFYNFFNHEERLKQMDAIFIRNEMNT